MFKQLARAWCRHNLVSWSPTHGVDMIGGLEREISGTRAPAKCDTGYAQNG
jgi:hypothetical protein